MITTCGMTTRNDNSTPARKRDVSIRKEKPYQMSFISRIIRLTVQAGIHIEEKELQRLCPWIKLGVLSSFNQGS